MNHRFTDAGRADFHEAIARYAAADLGKKFAEEVREYVTIIEANPQGFSRAPGCPRGREIRVVKIGRFDYLLYHEVLPTEVVIIAITHASRNDRGWGKRTP